MNACPGRSGILVGTVCFAVACWLSQPDRVPAQASRPPASPLALTQAQLARLNQALAEWHPRYDPAEQMIRRPFSSPGYHTTLKGGDVHPTRDSLNYAVALLDTGDPELLRRAEAILRRVIALQDQHPESQTYGIWSWFLEEPLDQMSPPDWNWADFCGVQLLQVALAHRHRLSPELAAHVDAAIKHAARSIQRRNVGPAYTNIAIMGTYVTLVAAELYQLDDLRDYTLQRLRTFHVYTMKARAFSEYNSPTYTVVALKELARLRQHARNAEARRLVEDLYRLAWEEIAQHFHAPTRQWAGPHSRAYRTLLPAETLALIQRSTDGRLRFLATVPPPSMDEHRLPSPCPRDLDGHFARLDEPCELVKTFVQAELPVIGTTWLHPQVALGSVNRGDFWNQRRALVAYWGTAEKPSYFHLRFLHDGYDFAAAQCFSVQRGGDVLAGVNFATDGGDTHPSLDRIKQATIRARDLRLRFEFGGTAGQALLAAPKTLDESPELKFGDLRLRLSVLYARLGETAGHWDSGRNEANQTAWLDVVLYSGESKAVRLSDLEVAVVGLAISFSTSQTQSPYAKASIQNGRLHLALETPRLSLALPTRPGRIADLQKNFAATRLP